MTHVALGVAHLVLLVVGFPDAAERVAQGHGLAVGLFELVEQGLL